MDTTMSRDNLTTYLNDHLAGSVVALELLGHMIRLQRGTAGEQVLDEIRREVEEDQKTLQGLLHEVGGKESRVRRAAAWLTEKLGRAKLHLDDPGSGDFEMLEALETLALGIQGKAALWRALAAARLPQARQVDLTALEQRALKQLQRAEVMRLQSARAALSL
jgi:hypothetical protein